MQEVGGSIPPGSTIQSYLVKIVLDTARWKCYFLLHSTSGPPLTRHSPQQ